MTNILNKIVVVIIPSDIILTGLAEILKGSQAGEIVQLHKGDQIIDYPELAGNVVVIATSEEIEKSGSLIRQVLSFAGAIQFIAFQLTDNPTSISPLINLYDSPSLICFKVNELLNSVASIQSKETDTELTRREIEVLQLITKGYSNKEIADQLFVSTHTVISHRKNISEKTGIKSASGLTMYAILKKIVDVSEINTSDLI